MSAGLKGKVRPYTGVLAALPLPLEYEAKTSGAVLQAISAVTFALPCAFVAQRWHRRLFECPKGSARPSLADLFQPQAPLGAVEAPSGHPARPRFKDVVDGLAVEHSLAPRERDVFRCLAMGYGSDRVAEELGVSVSTVHSHTHNVYVKLGIHSRDELMRLVDAQMG